MYSYKLLMCVVACMCRWTGCCPACTLPEPHCPATPAPRLICSDKTVLVWQLGNGDEGTLGFPKRALRGHSHYVQVTRCCCCDAGWWAGRAAGAAAADCLTSCRHPQRSCSTCSTQHVVSIPTASFCFPFPTLLLRAFALPFTFLTPHSSPLIMPLHRTW